MRSRSKSVKTQAQPSDDPAQLDVNVLFDVWLLSRAVTARLDAALAPSKLTADEFAIYSVLLTAEALTPTELARWMSAPPTSISSTVKRLEARGHVARVRNPTDGRSYRLQITAAGRRAHSTAGKEFLVVLAAVESALGSDLAAVRGALGRLRSAVSAD